MDQEICLAGKTRVKVHCLVCNFVSPFRALDSGFSHSVDFAIDLQWPSIVCVCSHEACRDFRITESAGSQLNLGAGKRVSKIHTQLTLARRSLRTVPPWFNNSFLSLSFTRNWGGSLISKKEPAEGKPFLSPFFFQFYLKGLLAMVVSSELLLWA